jgi:hypothetical protein
MSNNKKLFEEAIADAKALREAAVANAKASLEESFAPRISAMFEKRMRDEEKDEMEEIYKLDRNLDLVSMNEENLKVKASPEAIKTYLTLLKGKFGGKLSQFIEDELYDSMNMGNYKLPQEWNDEEFKRWAKMDLEWNASEGGEKIIDSDFAKDLFKSILNMYGVEDYLVEEGMDYNSDDNTGLEEEIDLEELFNALEEEDMDDDSMYEMDSELYEEEEMEENFDLEEILRELETEGEEVNEEDDMMNEMFDMENEAASGNEGIGEITVDELRDIIKSELASAGLGSEEGMEDMGGEEDMNMDFNFDDEGGEMEDEETEEDEKEDKKSKSKPKKKKSDEEELEELYSLYESMKKRRGYKGKPKEIDEAKKAGTSGGVAPHKNISSFSAAGKYKGPKVIKEEEDDMKEAMKSKIKAMMEKKKMMKGDVDKSKEEELKEAIRTIRTLRGQLNEVNLLNAKLIYVNRIFKANSLNEGQKVNVVNSFDKATTLNEAKNVYEILKTTIKKSSNKKALTENKTSFASKVIGGRPASQPIIKADDQISRMQKLAGIK